MTNIEFNKAIFTVVTAVNNLMQAPEIYRTDRHILKLIRFKNWLFEVQEKTNKEYNGNKPETDKQ